jgi:hypothetical protein
MLTSKRAILSRTLLAGVLAAKVGFSSENATVSQYLLAVV